MKKILLLIMIITLSLSVKSQSFFDQKDKQLHMKMSAALTATGFALFPDDKVEVVAVVLLIGITKELLIDNLRDNGNPSFEDMGANLIGTGAVITVNIGIDKIFKKNKKKKKKRYKGR